MKELKIYDPRNPQGSFRIVGHTSLSEDPCPFPAVHKKLNAADIGTDKDTRGRDGLDTILDAFVATIASFDPDAEVWMAEPGPDSEYSVSTLVVRHSNKDGAGTCAFSFAPHLD